MATLVSTYADTTRPVHRPDSLGTGRVIGTYSLTSNPAVNDVINLCYLPAGAIVTGFRLYATAMETSSSPTLALKLGVGSTSTALLGATAFTQSAVLDKNVLAAPLAELTAESLVYITFTGTAATFAAGTVYVTVDYIQSLSA